MVFARSLQPAIALPMYVPLCRPRKTARCSGRGRKTPARSALAGWRKPTAAGAGRGAQGMCSGVWSEARGCERRGARIGSSAGGAWVGSYRQHFWLEKCGCDGCWWSRGSSREGTGPTVEPWRTSWCRQSCRLRTPWIRSWRAGGSCLGWLYVCRGAHGREWRDLLWWPVARASCSPAGRPRGVWMRRRRALPMV